MRTAEGGVVRLSNEKLLHHAAAGGERGLGPTAPPDYEDFFLLLRKRTDKLGKLKICMGLRG